MSDLVYMFVMSMISGYMVYIGDYGVAVTIVVFHLLFAIYEGINRLTYLIGYIQHITKDDNEADKED